MIDLRPCPNPACTHWNPPDRKSCFACSEDLSKAPPRPPRRKGGMTWVIVAVVAAAVVIGAWWLLRGRVVAQDDVAPVLSVLRPETPTVRTSSETVSVSGRVQDEHPSHVEAGEARADVEDGAFELQVPVPADGGQVRIVAVDAAGNRSEPHVLDIVVDRQPPELVELEPEDGTVVVTPRVRVAGRADEPLSKVSVQDVTASVDGDTFRAEVPVEEGANTILITVIDTAGNETARSLTVTHQSRRLPAGFSSTGRTDTGHEVFRAAKDDTRMVLVPGGEFQMGSADGDSDEDPVHAVELSPYFIDVTPVTNERYAAFAEATGRSLPPAPPFDRDRTPDAPVVNVTWEDALAYAEWAGRDLPTEAQWELAARGTSSRVYPWGATEPTGENGLANIEGEADGHAQTSPVGTFPKGASPYGILDMAGNVWEWTSDRYSAAYYASSPSKDPEGPSSGGQRTVRGGAYTSNAADVRSANRWRLPPGSRRPNVGFRTVARFPDQP